MGNEALNKRKGSPNDEWYTRESVVRAELIHYREQLRGKTILCPANDTPNSAFIRVLRSVQEEWEIPEIAGISYEPNGTGKIWRYPLNHIPIIASLLDDGSLFGQAVAAEMKHYDIVITNPPFSLFREVLTLLWEKQKQFLLLGNQNMFTYKDVFSALKDESLQIGYTYGDARFNVPENTEPRKTRYGIDSEGTWCSLGNMCWLTNLKVNDKPLIPLKAIYDPSVNKRYDTYDAVEVGRVAAIPSNYDGLMGVPITFLVKWNPTQFKLIDSIKPTLAGKRLYQRVIIQRKDN